MRRIASSLGIVLLFSAAAALAHYPAPVKID